MKKLPKFLDSETGHSTQDANCDYNSERNSNLDFPLIKDHMKVTSQNPKLKMADKMQTLWL